MHALFSSTTRKKHGSTLRSKAPLKRIQLFYYLCLYTTVFASFVVLYAFITTVFIK